MGINECFIICKSWYDSSCSKVINNVYYDDFKTRIEVKFHIYALFQFSVSNNQILGIAHASKFNRIVQKLGIPEPPKRPATALIRFQKENIDSLRATAKSQNDLFSLIGAQWRQLSEDQKEKYKSQYKKEFVSVFDWKWASSRWHKFIWQYFQAEYQKVYKEYLQSLTPEQKKAIKTERKVLKENREAAAEKKLLKNELQSVGKPKKSAPAFMLYLSDKLKNSNVRAKDLKDDWANLNDVQKQAYVLKAQQLRDKYQ